MRFDAFIACVIVTSDCIDKATGDQAQTLFATNNLWIWWIAAFFWGLSALRQLRAA